MNRSVCFIFSIFTGFGLSACQGVTPRFDFSGVDHHVTLAAKDYPGAQLWFELMKTKYPEADLGKVNFCVSADSTYYSDYKFDDKYIYFPAVVLKRIHDHFLVLPDVVFKGSNGLWHCKSSPETDKTFPMFFEEEYLLLHEACHALHNDVQKGKYATMVTLVVAACTAINYVANKTSGAKFAAINVASILALCGYAMFQESRADGLANSLGSKEVLLAGRDFFKRIDVLTRLNNVNLPWWVNTLNQWFYDPFHPTPAKRMQWIDQVIAKRFGA